jgi:hypothetical protein
VFIFFGEFVGSWFRGIILNKVKHGMMLAIFGFLSIALELFYFIFALYYKIAYQILSNINPWLLPLASFPCGFFPGIVHGLTKRSVCKEIAIRLKRMLYKIKKG